MNAVQFSVLKWSAWAPGVHGLDQWQEWGNGTRPILSDNSVPALKQVPAMLRRRLSRLSKMSLQTVYDCAAENHQLRTVFSSPHGEIHRTKKLLDDIVAGESISPMGFSLSVHNTASGLYSIASGNKAHSTALASGVDTLESAVIEACAQLHNDDRSPVLVVLADEPVPGFYEPFNQGQAMPFALAMLLDRPGKGNRNIQLSLSVDDTEKLDKPCEQHGLALIRWLTGHGLSLENHSTERCGTGGTSWSWKHIEN